MKEAAGEANMTVITIVLIAIVLGVGTVIVNSVLSNTRRSSSCSSLGGIWFGGHCYATNRCTTDRQGRTSCTGANIDAQLDA